MVRRDDVKAETWAIVAGRPAPIPGAALNTAVIAASTYVLGGERIYSRNEATEGWESFEAMLGGLEGGEAVAFSSGMAASAAVLGQLQTGAHLVLGDDCYQGVAGIAHAGARTHQWRVERLPAADERWIARAAEADLLWLESPTNPLLDVADVAAICSAPRGPRTRVVVDNTFATPLRQRPLELGADIVVHSATKLIGGHSDLLLGAAVTADAAELDRLRAARALNGATPGMLECFLALRGARTLALRLGHAEASAQQLAVRLGRHPAVARVRYPGFGTIVSFELADGAAADRACRGTRIIRHATSLGGVETCMERRNVHPGQEHIPPGLIRLSVGCEDVEDVWRDLDGALRGSRSSTAMSTSPNDYNAQIIEEFRANGGRVASFEGATLLLLHHVGAKSGQRRVNPVVYVKDGERYVIFASKAGAPNNPSWYHNLKAHPEVTIEVGTETLEVTASEATGEERERLFRAQAERSPQFAEYQEKTDRVIPVVLLTPAAS